MVVVVGVDRVFVLVLVFVVVDVVIALRRSVVGVVGGVGVVVQAVHHFSLSDPQ